MANTGKANGAGEEQSSLRSWILKATGVLLVIPALLNGAHDLWIAILELPRTEAQRQNERLYRIHTGKMPVTSIPVRVKAGQGAIIEANVSVWDGGDVLVEYGEFTQWFPFPMPQPGKQRVSDGFSLIPSAYAQQPPAPSPKGQGPYVQSETVESGALVRERVFNNGVVERATINTRTGIVLSTSAASAPVGQVAAGKPTVVEAAPITVDLTARPAAARTPAENLKAGLAWCKQKSNFISRGICEYREREKYCDGPAADKMSECRR